jgi:hypothetical protein
MPARSHWTCYWSGRQMTKRPAQFSLVTYFNGVESDPSAPTGAILAPDGRVSEAEPLVIGNAPIGRFV